MYRYFVMKSINFVNINKKVESMKTELYRNIVQYRAMTEAVVFYGLLFNC